MESYYQSPSIEPNLNWHQVKKGKQDFDSNLTQIG